MNALAQLGMVSGLPRDIQNNNEVFNEVRVTDFQSAETQFQPEDDRKDYFITRDGESFAGNHLLIDFWGARNLDDPKKIDSTLRRAAEAAGATILHSHFHHFTPNGGVSGVLVLAESHISIHTWPERDFAAVDVFMCGACDPNLSVPVMQELFQARRVEVDAMRRGRVQVARRAA